MSQKILWLFTLFTLVTSKVTVFSVSNKSPDIRLMFSFYFEINWTLLFPIKLVLHRILLPFLENMNVEIKVQSRKKCNIRLDL